MSQLDLTQRWVLVTGASAGLGLSLARQLAQYDRADLVLVARRRERLEALAQELSAHGVRCQVLTADLADPAAVEGLFAELEKREIRLSGAILNAGVTHFGEHHDLSAVSAQDLIATNLTSLVRLASGITRRMREQGEAGRLMLISSLAGSTPVPYQSLYSGTKAFVTQFGLSLGYELRAQGISVTVFAPGGIGTEMIETSGLNAYFRGRSAVMPADVCAGIALKAFRRRQTFAVPGTFNRWGLLLSRLAGHRVSTCLVGAVYAKALRAKAAR